jgi:hypothetical protein
MERETHKKIVMGKRGTRKKRNLGRGELDKRRKGKEGNRKN